MIDIVMAQLFHIAQHPPEARPMVFQQLQALADEEERCPQVSFGHSDGSSTIILIREIDDFHEALELIAAGSIPAFDLVDDPDCTQKM